MVYAKDGPDVHTGIDVATAVEWVKHDTVLSPVFLVDDDGLFELFGD